MPYKMPPDVYTFPHYYRHTSCAASAKKGKNRADSEGSSGIVVIRWKIRNNARRSASLSFYASGPEAPGAVLQPFAELVQGIGLALGEELDVAVAQVADPAAEAEPPRLATGRIAEAHSLDFPDTMAWKARLRPYDSPARGRPQEGRRSRLELVVFEGLVDDIEGYLEVGPAGSPR